VKLIIQLKGSTKRKTSKNPLLIQQNMKIIFQGLLAPHCQLYDLCEVVDRESLVQLMQQIYDECSADTDGRFVISIIRIKFNLILNNGEPSIFLFLIFLIHKL